MKTRWMLIIALLLVNPARADWWQAINAYENKEYAAALQGFEQLITLGNEDAAYNLGAMYHNAEGVAADQEKALAYFMLAAELGRADAAELLERLLVQADAAQLAKTEQQLAVLRQSVSIWPKDLNEPTDTVELPRPVKRAEPRYPVDAARSGLFGYVSMRFLVDEQGKVQAIDVVDAYPAKTFDRESIRAVKRWQYEATGKKHLLSVRLDYSLEGAVSVNSAQALIDKHQLWQGSLLGSPQHQLLLGSVLRLMDVQSRVELYIDKSLPIDGHLNLAVFKPFSTVKADFDGFFGRALVRVAEDGRIIEQLSADFAPESDITTLLGLTLSGKIETDVYRLSRGVDQRSRSIYVRPSLSVPASLSAHYWWDSAAKNGSKEAQRIMAAYDERWEQYLLDQQDAEVMAWVGSRLMLEGQRNEGLALLDAAIAKQYRPALELKKQLM
ncbi:TonB family protein [Arsukibacterium sp.]|uniref:TonB family protein n=1 Tax=Arsukibacterium sp. TaxID=1977258 RepID=UPI002FDABB21